MPNTERCPFCGASVKAENLVRHLDANHPRNAEAQKLREELRRTPGRTAASRARPGFRLRRAHLAAILAVVVLLLGAYYVAPLLSPSGTDIVGYCGLEGTAQHYHTLLVIDVNGVQQMVPWYIGIEPQNTSQSHECPSGQLHVLHTHDGSGIIHNELPAAIKATPTLGDFFQIWGQPLGPTLAWNYAGTVSVRVGNAGTGHTEDFSSNPGSVPLTAPPNGQDPFVIPQGLTFNGTYGNGQSGGVFSGEIVFLNVTTG